MSEHSPAALPAAREPARFPACLRFDSLAGFLVFLIALPLCLAIAKASGFPPIAGVIAAIVGGLATPWLSNSELTIKGPAAGLIAIIAACVTDMAAIDSSGGAYPGYRMALAVGAAAAVVQIGFGFFKAGKLGDFFPTAAVHGLLASIGVIIMIRQFLLVLGVTDKTPGEAYELVLEYPHFMLHYNLPVAIIGGLGLAIMAVMPLLKNRMFRLIPAQVVVLAVTIPLAMWFHIQQPTAEELAAKQAQPAPAAAPAHADPHTPADPHANTPAAEPPADPLHSIELEGQVWRLPPDKFLINVPTDFREAFVFPDWSALRHPVAWKWVIMFAIIASLESLLSAKAVDFIDPFQRKTDLNRDLLGCGVANLISSCIGGLPAISEIVRSRANVDAGANTRLANLCHGVFLLVFAACFPVLLKMIPTAALAAMLTYTGFRLAHPREFYHMYQAGLEQLVVFVTTIVAIVCTDLLIGVLVGIATELAINVFRGLPVSGIFSPTLIVRETEKGYLIVAQQAVVFSNWLGLRSKIEALGLKANKDLVVDLTDTSLVDHTVMEKLAELEREFRARDLKLEIVGLDRHEAVSEHPTAARVRGSAA